MTTTTQVAPPEVVRPAADARAGWSQMVPDDHGQAGDGSGQQEVWLPEQLRATDRGSASLSEPEGLPGSSCGPPQKPLVRSAILAAQARVTASTWRKTLLAHGIDTTILDSAEDCARDAGVWPWPVEE